MTNSIRAIRESRKISQPDLAAMVGVHANTIRNWERGDTDPKMENLVALSAALGCTIEDLVTVKA